MALLALQSSATGLSALNAALDVTANNLANVNTAGFKASRVNFQDLLYIEKAQPGARNANNDERPTGEYVGLGVEVAGTQLSFAQGSVVQTDRELDVLIDGKGFFVVDVGDDVSEDGLAYTRYGKFTLNSDGELVLSTNEGRRLSGGIQIPEDATTVTIASNGEVLVTTAGDTTQQGVGNIELASFINPAGLKQVGENLFVQTDASGDPQQGEPGEEGLGTLLQGAYEGSNVDPTRELIELIRTQRAFEMNSNAIRAADETLQQISQLRR